MTALPFQIDLDLLERLSNRSGVSGDERGVRQLVVEEIAPFVTDFEVDPLGNLLIEQSAEEGKGKLKVMVAAHMDEVGFMLTARDGEGIYRFEKAGGIPDKFMAGKAVKVGKDEIPGVIGVKPVHFLEKKKKGKIVPLDQLRVDVGPEQDEQVQVGDRVVFDTTFQELEDHILGKAFDDRLGVALLVELVKHPPRNITLMAAFTVQEEIGLRGAGVAAFSLDPDCSVVLDTTPARDFPVWDSTQENIHYNTRLGAGAAIYTADAGTLSDPRLVDHFIRTAEGQDILYQRRQPGGGRTDAAAIHGQRAGIPSISISVPTRYLHSPVCVVNIHDYQSTLSLLQAGLETLPDVLNE